MTESPENDDVTDGFPEPVPEVGREASHDGAAEGSDLAPREGERIAKLLARAGIASRREVERMIAEGRVRLNGDVITTPATVLTSLHGLSVDGQPVRAAEATRLFAFHKPAGLLTAERDSAGRPTIYNALRNALPPGTPRLMPVGRLDLSTEGLLLLTNDGELKRALELPSTGIPRTYRARTYGEVTQDQLESLMEGIEIDGVRYGSIDANMERRTGANQWIELTLTEGKNREVRRVLEHLGLEVSRLIRTAYGMFYIEDLPRGTAVEIQSSKVEQLRRELKLISSSAASRGGVPRGERPQPLAGAATTKARSASPRVARKAAPSRPDEALGRRIKPTRPGRWDDERTASADARPEPRRGGARAADGKRAGGRPDGRRADGARTGSAPRSENARTDTRRSDGPPSEARRGESRRSDAARPDAPRVNTRRERSSSRDELLTNRPRGGTLRSDAARGGEPGSAKPAGKPFAKKPNNRPYAKSDVPAGSGPSGRTPPRGGPRNGPRGNGPRGGRKP